MDMESKNVSNCALQIALQTMKDRCQQLQLRLSNLEDENLKLRIIKRKNETIIAHDKEPEDNAIRKLHEEIETLSQQKSQLTHHIFMVATENKQLWTKLSMLTEEKSVPEQSLNLVKDNNKSDHFKEVDINIAKNLDGLDLSKTDTKESPSMKDFEFNLSMMSANGEDSNNFEIMELGEELNQTKSQLRTMLSQLRTQQCLMRATVKTLIQVKKDKENEPPPLCSNCDSSRKQLRDKTYKVNRPPALTNGNEGIRENNQSMPPENDNYCDEASLMVSAQVCPICQLIDSGEGNGVEDFLEHVYSHFGESNEENGSPIIHTGSNTLEHGTVFPQFNI